MARITESFGDIILVLERSDNSFYLGKNCMELIVSRLVAGKLYYKQEIAEVIDSLLLEIVGSWMVFVNQEGRKNVANAFIKFLWSKGFICSGDGKVFWKRVKRVSDLAEGFYKKVRLMCRSGRKIEISGEVRRFPKGIYLTGRRCGSGKKGKKWSFGGGTKVLLFKK